MLDIKRLLNGAKNIKTEYVMEFDVKDFKGDIEDIIDKKGLFYNKEYEIVKCLQFGNVTRFTIVSRD